MDEGMYLEIEGIGRGFQKERCTLSLEEEYVKHILLDCKENKKWRETFMQQMRT
jgi:hypothetical protein